MLTAHPSSVAQKRDLHVGGLGANAGGALAAVTYPLLDSADWIDRTRDAARNADDYVRDSPRAALAVAALVGLTAGFLLSRALKR
jgi:ElaB/YqjD/DUF883 family membrane-anchored ribosome-binding protein